MISYCKKCLYPSTKPDLWFREGVCGACHAYENRKDYDWASGPKAFKEVLKANKKNDQYFNFLVFAGSQGSLDILIILNTILE